MVRVRGLFASALFGLAVFACLAGAAAQQSNDPKARTSDEASWRAAVRSAEERGEVQRIDRAMAERSVAARGENQRQSMVFITRMRAQSQTVDAPVLTPRSFVSRSAALAPPEGEFVPLKRSYALRTVWDARSAITINGSCAIAKSASAERAAATYQKLRQRRKAAAASRLAQLNVGYEAQTTDVGLELTFSKFGCSYTLTATCLPEAGDNGACMDAATLAAIADDMLIANAPE